ncbi:MAG: hypothetical protein SGI90_16130 [Candidatus Eisenbacteria bacterium]|nr:hypothetical protein [Candidatus Eisenbacteria bacterium]
MTEITILLAIGLIALLVIWLVARNLEDERSSAHFRWIRNFFQSSPDRGNWWWMDRRLARIPELASLDRRERRRVYLEAWQSWKIDHQGLYWGGALGAGACIGIAQPLVERLCDWLMVRSNQWLIVGQIPTGLFEFSCASVIYMFMYMVIFSFTERGVIGRLLEMAHRQSDRTTA